MKSYCNLLQKNTRSSCPPSERWASQEPPYCGSSLTSQIVPSGCLGGVRFRSHNFLLLEFLKAQCLNHFSSDFAAVGIELLCRLARGEMAPRLSLVSPKVFFLRSVTNGVFGSLPLSPLACLVGDT